MVLAIKDYIEIASTSIAAIIFIKGIFEYSKAQKWKKAEFVSKEIKEFNNDFDIKRALILLDWNANNLELRTNEIEGESHLHYTDELIISSLHTHLEISQFKREEVVIKGIFDKFCDWLTLFDNYIESGLITAKDIRPYLIYWINILANPQNDRKPVEVREQIWKYIDAYGYNKLKSFCIKVENADNSNSLKDRFRTFGFQ